MQHTTIWTPVYYHYIWSRCSFVNGSLYNFIWCMLLFYITSKWYKINVLTTYTHVCRYRFCCVYLTNVYQSGPPTCSSCRFHDRRHATATGVSWSTVWNSLPVVLRSPDTSLDIFKDKLKIFLFRTVYWMRICGLGEFAGYKLHYYYY